MSGINGDKSRFHRVRKQNIARRMRNRKLFQTLAKQRKPASAGPGSKAEAAAE